MQTAAELYMYMVRLISVSRCEDNVSKHED